MNPLVIAPSLLAADFNRIGDEAQAVCKAGAQWLHIDVMDGHFVPNLSFGLPVVKGLAKGPLPLDIHLMVTNPENYLEGCAEVGAKCMTVHCEATFHLQRLLCAIRSKGMLAGVALNPATSPAFLEYLKDDVDLVLIMTVNPGFGGQAFLPAMLEKIRWVRATMPAQVRIEVDGGVGPSNSDLCRQAGADTLVAGSSVFGTQDYAQAIAALRS